MTYSPDGLIHIYRRFQVDGIYRRFINVILLSYAFLLPFSSTYTIHTAPFILLFFWVIDGNLSGKTKTILHNKPARYFLLFFIFSAFSLLWTHDLHHGYKITKLYFAHVIVFIIIITSVEKRFIKYILTTFIIAMFLSEIASYGIMMGFWKFKGSMQDPSPFMHHIHYSVYLVTTIIILLENILKKSENIYLKFLEILFVTSSTINLFMNGGRTGQVAYILAIIIFFSYYYHFKIKYILTSIAIVFITITTAYNISHLFESRIHMAKQDIENILYKKDFTGSWGQRVGMKFIAANTVLRSPLFGFGVGDDMNSYKKVLNSKKMQEDIGIQLTEHVHDQYLQILLQTGLIGLFFFIMFVFHLFDVIKIDCTGERRLKQATLLAFLTTYLFTFFCDLGFKSHLGTLFIFMAAVLYCRLSSECGVRQIQSRNKLSKIKSGNIIR